MDNKTCVTCKLELPLSAFSRSKHFTLDGRERVYPRRTCMKCNRERYKEYYKAKYEKRASIIRKTKDVPCVDCGNRFHFSAMDFDHLEDKHFNIGTSPTCSMKKLLAEIEKCEIVCANCHRVRTWQRSRNG